MEIIDLEMIPGGPKKTCHASQFDNGRVIRFNLKENGQPFALSGTETVQAIIRKPDGSETTLDIANTSSTYVDLITEEDTCDIAGVNHCEMKVTEDGEDLGSGNFDMKVEEDAYGAGDVSAGTASGPIASFETDIKDDLIECLCDIVVTGGNGTPDNPNPINGYTKANITRCGVNLFKNTFNNTTINQISYTKNSDGSMRVSGTATGGFAQAQTTVFLKAGNYIISDNCTFPRNRGLEFYCNASASATTRYNDNVSFTVTKDGVYNVYIYIANGVSIDTTIYPMIRRASVSDTNYHPYTGNAYTITFGQTVYGGVLDVTRGKLKPCIEYPSYNGETLSGRWLSSEATYIEGTTPPTGSQVVSLDDYGSDIDLTPEQIETLDGQKNNVYHNANGNTAVKFYTRA